MTEEIQPDVQKPDKTEKVRERIEKDKEEFLEVLRESTGIITIACQRKGMARATFYNWSNTDPEFKKKVEEIKKEQIGIVEDRLLKAILEGNVSAIIFYLKCKSAEFRPRSEISFGDKEKVDETLDKIKKIIEP